MVGVFTLYAGAVPAENMDPGTLLLLEICFAMSVVCVLLSAFYAAFEFIEWLVVGMARLADRYLGDWINDKLELLATKGITLFKRNLKIDRRNFWNRELSLTEIVIDFIGLSILLMILSALLLFAGLGSIANIIGLAEFIVIMLSCLALAGAWRYAKMKFGHRSEEKQ